MRFKFEDKEYEWDTDRLTVEEAMLFQDKTGFGVQELNEALIRGNPYATVTLVYLAKTRAGEAVRWQDLLKCDIASYEVLPPAEPARKAADDEPDEEGKPERRDPTSKGGRTRKAATSATS